MSGFSNDKNCLVELREHDDFLAATRARLNATNENTREQNESLNEALIMVGLLDGQIKNSDYL
jgi:hypothetical protein